MKKIVLVDDDPDIIRVAEIRLRAAGFAVYSASDGLSGLELIRAEQPQVAILDLMMPKLHGFALCQELRKDPTLQDMQIIISSAKPYPVDVKKSKEVGANDYLLKPYDFEVLMEKINRAFESWAPAAMQVKFWGTRGSIPTPGKATQKFGGNTSCVEVRCEDTILMFDCGSGAREMGLALKKEMDGRPLDLHIFVSHTHWDHIQGFPFFVPAYTPGTTLTLYSLRGSDKSLEKVFTGQMDASYFPVSLADMMANLKFVELDEGALEIGPARISHIYLNHPGVAVGFRVDAAGRSLAYISDHEVYCRISGDNSHNRKLDGEIDTFVFKSDLYIREAQYTEEEYLTKKGWGHSTWKDAVDSAHRAQVKRLALYHHDPMHDDELMEAIVKECEQYMDQNGMNFECLMAADNLQVKI